MKKFIRFINDSLVIFCLFCIVIGAFMATYALSPIAYEKSALAYNKNDQSPILGKSDFKNLEFTNIYKEHEYFTVKSASAGGEYKADIILGPVSEGEFKKAIVQIYNPSESRKTAIIKLIMAQNLSDVIEGAVVLDKEKYILNAGNDYSISVEIKPGQKQDLSILLNLSERFNYTLNINLAVSSD